MCVSVCAFPLLLAKEVRSRSVKGSMWEKTPTIFTSGGPDKNKLNKSMSTVISIVGQGYKL